jgi:uncharacterized protein YbjT (DUF2867 family)
LIIVTGATGKLGTRIVERLLTMVPARELGVSVRDPDKAAGLAAKGVRVRRGDFTNPRHLVEAFEGAHRVVIISAAIRGYAAAVTANAAAIDAACSAGANHIIYTSHQAASADSLFPPMRVHNATERHLEECGVPFTALRNGFYNSAIGAYLGDVEHTGQITLPTDGPVLWTDHDDLAEVAAVVATGMSDMVGVSPPLTGSVALDFSAIAELVSEVGGKPVTRVVIDDDEWKATQIAAGRPAAEVDFHLGFFRAARRREFAVGGSALEEAVGHSPVPVRTAIRRLLVRP